MITKPCRSFPGVKPFTIMELRRENAERSGAGGRGGRASGAERRAGAGRAAAAGRPSRQRVGRRGGSAVAAGGRAAGQSLGRAAKDFLVLRYQPIPEMGFFHLPCMSFRALWCVPSPPATISFRCLS